MKILIIDDDPLLRRTIARGLGNHEVDTADSAQAGKLRMQSTDYDLVLSDVQLGDGRGTELRAWAQGEGIEIGCFALMTGSPMSTTEQAKLRADGLVLEKPFGRAAIEALIASLTDD